MPEVCTAIRLAKKLLQQTHLHLEELEEKQQLLECMIERLCEQQVAVAAVLHNHRDLLHLEHSLAEWRLLEDLCKVLEPFKDATTYLSTSSRYPTLSGLEPVLHKILKSLEEDTSSSAISTVKRFKRTMPVTYKLDTKKMKYACY